MIHPIEVTFRNMPHSDTIEAMIRRRADKLERFHSGIISCRVVVEVGHTRRPKGRVYHVRLDVRVPGGELVAGAEPEPHHHHEDVQIAIRDAFDSMRRELEDFVQIRRGDVKAHGATLRGRVMKLFRKSGYGFISTPEDGEIYFHQNCVQGGFEQLEIGTEVRFTQEDGDAGPQAIMVAVVE